MLTQVNWISIYIFFSTIAVTDLIIAIPMFYYRTKAELLYLHLRELFPSPDFRVLVEAKSY